MTMALVAQGSAAQRSRRLFPATLGVGALDFWFRGDEPAIGVSAGPLYRRVRNRGAKTPGSLTTAGGDVPMTTRGAGGLRAPLHTAGRSLVGTTDAMARMHQSGTNCELWVAVYLDSAATAGHAIRTAGANAENGFYLSRENTNRIALAVFNGGGSPALALFSGATTVTTGFFVVRLTKASLAYAIELNGGAYTSGAASALAVGTVSSNPTSVGGTASGAAQLPGSVCEAFLVNRALTAGEATSALAYLQRWA